MTFAHPSLLWVTLGIVPALAAFFWWSWRTRKRLIARFVPDRLRDSLTLGVSSPRTAFRAFLLIAGLTALLLALARPRYGAGTVEVSQRALDILIAIDTSRSMLAEDAGPGITRLQRAKYAALDLARLARNDRVGLVAFAGSAFLQCPLTVDGEAFRQSVESLDTSIIPQGGTALGPAIHSALDAFSEERENVRVLVMFTDGEEHERGALDAAKRAQAKGLRIFTVGVGTARGEIIRMVSTNNASSYLKDAQGNVVKSSLNEPLLRELAAATGGLYLPLQGPNAMSELFTRALEPLPRADLASRLTEQFYERFQWPLGLALVLFLFDAVLPERARARGRIRAVTRTHPTLAQVATLFLLLAVVPLSQASPKSALQKYEKKDFPGAQLEFERLSRQKPADPRLRFNAGAAAYRAGDFEKAAKYFQEALASTDLQLQEGTYYNLGNTQYQAGEAASDPADKRASWEQSLQSFEAALKLDAQNTNAQHNLEFVRRRLEELKPPPSQQQQQSKDSKDPKDESKDQDQDQKPEQDQKQDQKQDQDQDQKSEPKQSQDQKDSPDESQSDEAQEPPPDSPGESQPPPDPRKDNPAKAAEPNSDSKESPPPPTEPAPSATPKDADAPKPGEMSRQQALRLLDAAKAEERLIPLEKRKARNRTVKDW